MAVILDYDFGSCEHCSPWELDIQRFQQQAGSRSFFREFSQLRTDIESFMDGMKSGLIKDLDKIAEKAGQFDKRFRSIKSKTTFDFIIFTKRFRAKIQNELDDILERSGYNLAGGNR